MRRVGIFMVISAAALVLLFYNSQKFDPGVELPEVDAGKPFTRWDGIVITCMPDGKLLLNGKPLYLANAVEELEAALKHREPKFRYLRKKLPREYRGIHASFVPVLVCMQKDTPIEEFFDILDILYRVYCINIYLAGNSGASFQALSFCSCVNFGRGFYFWREQVPEFSRKALEVRVRIDGKGKFFFDTSFVVSHLSTEKPVTILEEYDEISKTVPRGTSFDQLAWRNPSTAPSTIRKTTRSQSNCKTIEYLFDLIGQHWDKDVVILLDIIKYSNNLTWDWLVKLLARLEKTGIKGYAFAAPD